jgi:dihydroorotase-like cyclic amidohydrolase
MTTRIKSDRIVLPDGIASGYVYFEDGRITAVGADGSRFFDTEYDFTGCYVSPGFIDITPTAAVDTIFPTARMPL